MPDIEDMLWTAAIALASVAAASRIPMAAKFVFNLKPVTRPS